MHEIIDVQTGGVAVGLDDAKLKSSGIGSCVVIVLMNTSRHVAGIAHTMLPNRCPEGSQTEETRYVDNALDVLTGMLKVLDTEPNNMVACIVGGGNVLKREDANICEMNIESVREGLKSRGIRLVAEDVGGDERRKVTVNISEGNVWFARGNGEEEILFDLNEYLGK